MKQLTTTLCLTIAVLLGSAGVSWASIMMPCGAVGSNEPEPISIEDLVKRDGIFYKKFSDVPFSGEVTGKFSGEVTGEIRGEFRLGNKECTWFIFRKNGHLFSKGTYKEGKKHGPWVTYHKNGQLNFRETFKDDKMDGPWVSYWDNGQLQSKGTYKDGKKDGPWVSYNEDGTVSEWRTGTYKDGVKVK